MNLILQLLNLQEHDLLVLPLRWDKSFVAMFQLLFRQLKGLCGLGKDSDLTLIDDTEGWCADVRLSVSPFFDVLKKVTKNTRTDNKVINVCL